MEITLILNDQLSQGLRNVSKSLDEVHDNFRKLGREISSVGQNLTFLGAGVMAPFVVALNKVANTNDEVAKSFKQINSATDKLYQSIATSLVPILQTFTGLIVTLSNWWFSLNASVRDAIVQFTFLAGAFLTVGGLITIVIGKLVSLAAGIAGAVSAFSMWAALNIPLLATLAAITVLIGLMLKFKGIANTVTSTFEVLVRFLMNGFHTVNAAIGGMVTVVLNGLAFIVEGIARFPGPTQEAFKKMAESIRETANTAKNFANFELKDIADNTQKIGDIFATGEGQWSNAFQGGIDKVNEFIGQLGKLQIVGKQAATTVAVSWTERWGVIKNVTSQMGSALNQMATENKKFAVAAKAVSIGIALMNAAESITNIWAKWGAYPPVAIALSAVSAAATGLQIAAISAQQFAVGTPNVPADMMAQVHKGETIIPATFADSIRRGDLSLSGAGGGGGGDIQINLYGITINSKENIKELAEELGFEVDRKFRNARSRV